MYALNIGIGHEILSATMDKYANSECPRVAELPSGDITLYDYIDEQFVFNAERAASAEEAANVAPAPTQAEINAAHIDYIMMMEGL